MKKEIKKTAKEKVSKQPLSSYEPKCGLLSWDKDTYPNIEKDIYFNDEYVNEFELIYGKKK